MPLPTRHFDALILGAGGAGLNAAIQLANAELRVAVVTAANSSRVCTMMVCIPMVAVAPRLGPPAVMAT